MVHKHQCGVCCKENVERMIAFEDQVVCHHFLKSSGEKEELYRLAFGQCQACGTLQLVERIPIEALTPRYNWLKCNEPEDHLDKTVELLSRLPGITKDSKIGGISFKDDTTLLRLNKLGFKNTWRADLFKELGATDPLAWFESVQANFNEGSAERLLKNHGKADIFIARHIIEHSYDLHGFISLCKKMVKPSGHLFFEIPDCERALANFDYTTLWEEHLTYFTGTTFRYCLEANGLSLVHFERIPYSIEDSYVGIVRIAERPVSKTLEARDLNKELLLGKNFADNFPAKKARIQDFFVKCRQQGKNVALFGGGHMSSVFLNVFDLGNKIDFVVDDNPNMRGMFMPGSRLPVMESKEIYDQNIDVCLLTLSASSEDKVVKNHQKFIEKGGKFVSIFPGSKWAMET
ncbi:MAG: methyltransferase domain-containing protein [Candidatus Omnitrophica bacterium]|nr:methyltransferase domain-containing protein [Candidatus Omnitrophota bacterium]